MTNIIIYVTCKSEDEAWEIASALLEADLIACANIRDSHRALYKWEGKVEDGHEVSMLLKTRSALFDKVRKKICEMHSYECPCIVAMPISEGHEPFLSWIEEQTVA